MKTHDIIESGKLPGWLLRAAGDLFSAQNRVDSVINDEVCRTETEIKNDFQNMLLSSACALLSG